eukprot:COSAG05_NODE_2979_length_2440_cov_6.336181_1_plen_274_part_00
MAKARDETERVAAQAATELEEAHELSERATQIQQATQQKEQATSAQAMVVSRERLQLASEQRDLTASRQKAEADAEAAKDKSRKLEKEIGTLKRQIANAERSAATRQRHRAEGARGNGDIGASAYACVSSSIVLIRLYWRQILKWRAGVRAGGLRPSGVDIDWEDDRAKTQNLLRQHTAFLQELSVDRGAGDSNSRSVGDPHQSFVSNPQQSLSSSVAVTELPLNDSTFGNTIDRSVSQVESSDNFVAQDLQHTRTDLGDETVRSALVHFVYA